MPQRILGLDIGANAVKAVVVESTYRSWAVVKAARAAVPPGGEGAAPLLERQVQAVRELLDKGLAFDSAMVALPGTSASHVVALPFTDLRRIEQTVGFEVEGQIPFDLAEVAWDWQPLQQREGRTDLLVAVVKKDVLAALLTALEQAGVDPRAVVPPGPSYASLFSTGAVASDGGGDADGEGTDALLDVGASRATVCLVTRGTCEAARTFPSGPTPNAAALARELRATVRSWLGRGGSGRRLRRLLLAGDGCPPGLAEALGAEVDGPIQPLALAGPAAEAIPAGEAPAFALAMAMALRGHQGPRDARLNLRRRELAYRGDFEHLRGKVTRIAMWTAVVLLLAMVSSGVKVFALARQERLLDAALCDATQRLVGKCYTNDELAVAVLRGRGTVTAAIPKESAVDVFTELSLRSPSSVPLKFDRIEITRDKLHLQGTTNAAEDVDKIVSSLRASRCFGEARSGGARKRSSDGKFEFTIDSDITCDTGDRQPPARG